MGDPVMYNTPKISSQKECNPESRSLHVIRSSLTRLPAFLFLLSVIISVAEADDFCDGLTSITASAQDDFRTIAEWDSTPSSKDISMTTTVELPNSSYPHVLRYGRNTWARCAPAGSTIYKTWMYGTSMEMDAGIIKDYRQVVSDVRRCLPPGWRQSDLDYDAIYKMLPDETLGKGTVFSKQDAGVFVEIRLSKMGSYQILLICRRGPAPEEIVRTRRSPAPKNEFCSAVRTIISSGRDHFNSLKGTYHSDIFGGQEHYETSLKLPGAKSIVIVPVHLSGEEPRYQLKCDMQEDGTGPEARKLYETLGIQLRNCLDEKWETREITWSEHYRTRVFTRYEDRGTSIEKKTEIMLSVQTREGQKPSLELLFLEPE
jgi:hypothetical protein